MTRLQNPGRTAGLWYLLLALLGPAPHRQPLQALRPRQRPVTVSNILAHKRFSASAWPTTSSPPSASSPAASLH